MTTTESAHEASREDQQKMLAMEASSCYHHYPTLGALMMKPLMTLLCTLLCFGFLPATEPVNKPNKKIRVLIIDGQNNHKWKETTPILKNYFSQVDHFSVDVANSPAKGDRKAMENFAPDLTNYDVVVSNYNGDPWSPALNRMLEERLKAGKLGLVIIHAANNAFRQWPEYNQMIGLGWRDANFGTRIKLDDKGKTIIVPKGEDLKSGHRYTGPFAITIRNADHPITRGMPSSWMHARDELYDNLRGPAENIQILATAHAPANKSTQTSAHEPMIWTVSYGRGRVFHTPMGHDVNAMKCVGFQVTLLRGTEWAATGEVVTPIPKKFPTETESLSHK